MYDLATRRRALALVDRGFSLNSVSKQTGISRHALRQWLTRVEPRQPSRSLCSLCRADSEPPADARAYAYLLGLYLGDGCVSKHPNGSFTLRIVCADAWPGLIEACGTAMKRVLPENSVCVVQRQGCVAVASGSKHWPCLFPQHGPGKKHERSISLVPWQQRIVDAHPWDFLRGLVHSDGCRMTNWTTRLIGGERKRYEYPRYFFTNKSDDIRRLYCDTLDRVGVEWTVTRRDGIPFNVSVARRASVALMDAHIGPKH
ncbi:MULTISPECIES: transcriptional regulator [Streptomyces]|uniref:transcriptional regulator n=1 Tax=Streptomyces TaxID=1883 RepID=UPI00163BAAA4|nr:MULTISPECIES: transcriptional regulator [Streptomyces]MBC2877153.1 transcriptional regulator [Streptomyces sp. TYQ1024]UBI39425.1 transcriptional regulator [Streptomyces mobaraensis]UKW32005.1 transcriptional regulator [Streptomyces sp. TYQ1024]